MLLIKTLFVSVALLLTLVSKSQSSLVDTKFQESLINSRLDRLEAKIAQQEKVNVEQENVILIQTRQLRQLKIENDLMKKTMQEIEQWKTKSHSNVQPIIQSSKNDDAIELNNESGLDGRADARATMPSTCLELSVLGHTIRGFYTVRSVDLNKIETVYCDFSQLPISTGYETRIGYNDIKSNQVYFYVQRNRDYNTLNTVVNYDLERLNVGGAMNSGTGVFTAPVDGIYFFTFSSIKDNSGTAMNVNLRQNGVSIGSAYGGPYVLITATSQATLICQKGDKIDLYLSAGILHDDGSHTTHFTGFLVEENLSSLTF